MKKITKSDFLDLVDAKNKYLDKLTYMIKNDIEYAGFSVTLINIQKDLIKHEHYLDLIFASYELVEKSGKKND